MVRDALYNAGCWEVARLGWEETYGPDGAAPETIEEDGTAPTVVAEFESMAELVHGEGG